MEGLIESGLYGDISTEEAARLLFLFVAALKLMNIAVLIAALF